MSNTPSSILTDGFTRSFEILQQYTQAYGDVAAEALQRSVEQSLYFRARIDTVLAHAARKAQELSQQEQDLVLDTSEAFSAQLQAGAKRWARLAKTRTEES